MGSAMSKLPWLVVKVGVGYAIQDASGDKGIYVAVGLRKADADAIVRAVNKGAGT